MSTTTVELTPPETLTPPAPVAPVAKEQAAGMVKLEPVKLAELDVKVEQFVNTILIEGAPGRGRVFIASSVGLLCTRQASARTTRRSRPSSSSTPESVSRGGGPRRRS